VLTGRYTKLTSVNSVPDRNLPIISFFLCPITKAVWGCVGTCIGADCIPNSVDQYYIWMKTFLPHGDNFYVAGLAAITWAIWKTRNKIYFEDKLLSDPKDIIYHACVFLKYWVDLLSGLSKEDLM
jgi:hypothetical protein